ncbi:unnamed protein product [Boreogadus saida]
MSFGGWSLFSVSEASAQKLEAAYPVEKRGKAIFKVGLSNPTVQLKQCKNVMLMGALFGCGSNPLVGCAPGPSPSEGEPPESVWIGQGTPN